MKLFNDNAGSTYNENGSALYDTLHEILSKIAKTLDNPRELQIIAADAAAYAASATCISRAVAKRKEEREVKATSQ